ncbi:hypothetical protein [Hyphomicrobium sp. 802]|uniref:hypothetical protein n=1 Tax=unclassified Hyphomicrobium TaxID=2619925 RepID=UPI00045E87FA|nr:hypothetical protein [Hyphomicrobium sp. 802]
MIDVPIKTRAGDTVVIDVAVVDEDTGAPINLSTAILRWGIRPRLIAGGRTVSKSSLPNDGIVIMGASSNVARVTVPKGELPAGKWTHELEVTLASGASLTVASGNLDADPAVFPA